MYELDQNSAKTLQDTKTLRIVLELQDIKHQIRKKKSKQATMKMDTEDTNHYRFFSYPDIRYYVCKYQRISLLLIHQSEYAVHHLSRIKSTTTTTGQFYSYSFSKYEM